MVIKYLLRTLIGHLKLTKPTISTAVDQLPDTIRILHKKYTLNRNGGAKLALKGRLGEIDFQDNEINFLDLGCSDTADTLIHEMLHGLWNVFDIGDDEDNPHEEHLVTVLATGIVTIMKDNPDLFRVLQDIVDEDSAEPAQMFEVP